MKQNFFPLLLVLIVLPLVLSATVLGGAPETAATNAHAKPRTEFVNVERWPDDHGVHLNAHGGGILYHEGAYYWFGEHKAPGPDGNFAQVGVHCYRSTDLYDWIDAGIALPVSTDPTSDITKGSVIERPKVIYNAASRKFVMWFHLELKGRGYRTARAAVAVADQVTGPYTFLRSFRANPGVEPIAGADNDPKSCWRRDLAGGQMSRDMTLFVDDDGKAYQITASEDNSTLHVHELTADYLGYSGRWARILPGGRNEAPAVIKHAGRYWMITSGLSGWSPNAARSAVADNLFGPWTELGNPARGYNSLLHLDATKTFGAQSTFILPVQGRNDAFIALFDVWREKDQEDSRYIWLPLRFFNDRFQISWMDRWDLHTFDRTSSTETTLSSAH